MQHKDIVSDLPPEISTTELIPYLPLTAVYQSMQVSTQWHGFFCPGNNDVWQHLMMRHFSITSENMALLKKLASGQINFYTLYECLHRVKQKLNPSEFNLSEELLLPEMQLQFLACCLDDDAVVRAVIPPDEKPLWIPIALAADAVNAFKYCIENNNAIDRDKIIDRLDKKRVAIFKFLLTPGHALSITPDLRSSMYTAALTTCGPTHIQYLLDHHYPDSPEDILYFVFSIIKNIFLPLRFIHDVIIKYNLISMIANKNYLYLAPHILRETPDPDEHLFIGLLLNQGIYPSYLNLSTATRLAERNHLDYLKSLLTNSDCPDSTCYNVLVPAAKNRHLTLDFLLFLLNTNSHIIKPTNEEVLETLITYNYFDAFLFLLNPDNGYPFTVTQKTLIAAAKSPHTRFLSWLLAHREKYQLQVDSSVLAAAVSTSYCKENVRVLIEQEQCVLTEDMLVELIKIHGCDRYSAAEMDFVMDLLQPAFGITCSQATLNQLLYHFHWEDQCYDQAYLFILFFVKSRFNLSLSQEQFEILYTCLYRIADLLDDPNFSHLKPSSKMVKWAIYCGLYNDVTYFLLPYFGLPITVEYLNHAAEYGRTKMVRFLLAANPDLKPSQNTIGLLLRTGNVALAQEYLEKYNIDINHETFLKDVLNYRPAAQAFGLALAAAHHVYPTTSMLGSFFGGNFFCVRRAMDPRYDINFASEINHYFHDKPANRQLMQSHITITAALASLSKHDEKQADMEVNESINLSRRQFFRVAIYALANPERYQLDNAAKESLLVRVTQALAGFSSFTVIEQREIKQRLEEVGLESLIDHVSSPRGRGSIPLSTIT